MLSRGMFTPWPILKVEVKYFFHSIGWIILKKKLYVSSIWRYCRRCWQWYCVIFYTILRSNPDKMTTSALDRHNVQFLIKYWTTGHRLANDCLLSGPPSATSSGPTSGTDRGPTSNTNSGPPADCDISRTLALWQMGDIINTLVLRQNNEVICSPCFHPSPDLPPLLTIFTTLVYSWENKQ